eukprot:TRINITY_DN400728_c0_g4_i2.p1 TRINITY_DN400728_c0_g4~~TRINITY_DN400728_c0_g4_i2.p1  ORF type:complete len:755 (-),score=234.35 TRINITY_DN400728_c0_g4_i2:150-2174(-)
MSFVNCVLEIMTALMKTSVVACETFLCLPSKHVSPPVNHHHPNLLKSISTQSNNENNDEDEKDSLRTPRFSNDTKHSNNNNNHNSTNNNNNKSTENPIIEVNEGNVVDDAIALRFFNQGISSNQNKKNNTNNSNNNEPSQDSIPQTPLLPPDSCRKPNNFSMTDLKGSTMKNLSSNMGSQLSRRKRSRNGSSLDSSAARREMDYRPHWHHKFNVFSQIQKVLHFAYLVGPELWPIKEPSSLQKSLAQKYSINLDNVSSMLDLNSKSNPLKNCPSFAPINSKFPTVTLSADVINFIDQLIHDVQSLVKDREFHLLHQKFAHTHHRIRDKKNYLSENNEKKQRRYVHFDSSNGDENGFDTLRINGNGDDDDDDEEFNECSCFKPNFDEPELNSQCCLGVQSLITVLETLKLPISMLLEQGRLPIGPFETRHNCHSDRKDAKHKSWNLPHSAALFNKIICYKSELKPVVELRDRNPDNEFSDNASNSDSDTDGWSDNEFLNINISPEKRSRLQKSQSQTNTPNKGMASQKSKASLQQSGSLGGISQKVLLSAKKQKHKRKDFDSSDVIDLLDDDDNDDIIPPTPTSSLPKRKTSRSRTLPSPAPPSQNDNMMSNGIVQKTPSRKRKRGDFDSGDMTDTSLVTPHMSKFGSSMKRKLGFGVSPGGMSVRTPHVGSLER